MGKSTRGRNGRIDVVQVFSAPKRSVTWQIVGMIIRARAELFVFACVLATVLWLRSVLSPVQANVTLVVIVVVLFGLPWSRRFLVARVWCVMDRHRLRACLRQAKVRTMNMDGSLPFMLWARPTRTGERVWLWVRAGSSGGDIEDALEYIAPACLARSARLRRVHQLTTIVAVEIIRRDPLAKSTLASPLATLTARFRATVHGEGTDPIAAAPHPVTVLRPAPWPDTTGGPVDPVRKNTKTARVTASVAAPTVVVNGEDLSDYVD